MSKQTAVEWLMAKIAGDLSPSYGHELQAKYEQALAMEREQIVEAWCDEMPRMIFALRAERYYERTYGKEASHES